MMSSILLDVRFLLRQLQRSPGFFATLIAVLVAGVGATTAMFSIAESLVLRPLPFDHPEELTMVWRTDPRVPRGPTSIANFLDWRERATSFDAMAANDYDSFSLSSEGASPESLPGSDVSGDFFRVFRVQPLRGRLLGPDDDKVGGPRVAVVSAALWHRRFGSDPTLVGKAVRLNGEVYTVVGIAPEGFTFGGINSDRADVWTPLAVTHPDYEAERTKGRGDSFLSVVGRRKPGVSLAQAQAQMTAISLDLQAQYPDANAKKTVTLMDLQDALVGSAKTSVWILFGAVLLVFVIVCSNVANLLLSRAQSRRGEMAARAALGASPARLVGQIVTETTAIFLVAGAGGAAAARWLVDLFADGVLADARAAAGTIAIRVDGVALAFALVACFACGVVFGLIPAVAASHVEPQAVLKESAARAGISATQRRIRDALVVAQVALACALLVASGLALEAFADVARVPPGFDPTNLVMARIDLPPHKYDDPARSRAFFRDVMAGIAREPGVSAVAANSTLPLAGHNNNDSFHIEGRPEWAKGDQPNIEHNIVTPGYFATMGVPLLRGRDFAATDVEGSRRVMIISKAAADRFFPGEDPVGKRISLDDSDDGAPRWREIVGVVGDVRRNGLTQPIEAEAFLPLAQCEATAMSLVVRAARPDAVLQALPGIVERVDPQQAVVSRRTMQRLIDRSIGAQRSVSIVLAAFAGAALLLASLGVFGVVSYSTAQRTREIGIRLALGSTPERVVGLVVRDAATLVATGLALGLVAAVAIGRVLAARVEGVHAFDPAVFGAIPFVLALAGVLAGAVPAVRAVRIPPGGALRYE
jgi:putative ABC transport system permease protein